MLKITSSVTGGLVAVAALIGLSGGAAAQGYNPSLAESVWSGVYAGVHAGAEWKGISWTNVSLTGETVSFKNTGFIGGAHAGVQRQFGNIVAGVELSYSGIGGSSTKGSIFGGGVTYTSTMQDLFTLAGRLGLAMDSTLLYVKGGYANANVGTSGAAPLIPDSFSTHHRMGGYVLGFGAEWKVQRNVSLGLEYDYVQLGKRNFSGATQIAIPYTITGVDAHSSSIMARLTYRFGDERRTYEPMK